MPLRALVDLGKQFKWTTSPRLLHQTIGYGDGIEARFDERRSELWTLLADEPCQNLGVVEKPLWNAAVWKAACWKFPEYSHHLLLERPKHHDRCSVLFWTARDEEMNILHAAAETRAERIAAVEKLPRHIEHVFSELAELGFRQWPLKMALVDDLSAIPPERARTLLLNMLNYPEPDHRCNACDLLLELFGDAAIPAVLTVANDPVSGVASFAIGLLNRARADGAVEPLGRILASHPDVEVRAAAAHALGGIGSPGAIPALLTAFEFDHETTFLGHSAGSISESAICHILDCNETDDGSSAFEDAAPKPKSWKARARRLYERWRAEQTDSGDLSTQR